MSGCSCTPCSLHSLFHPPSLLGEDDRRERERERLFRVTADRMTERRVCPLYLPSVIQVSIQPVICSVCVNICSIHILKHEQKQLN